MTKLVNRAKMTTATTGTGTITLGSAVDGYQTFADAGVSDAAVVSYAIEDGTAWEIGTGTYTASGTTLSRTVTESSNAGAAINLTGNAVIFVTARAEDLATGGGAPTLATSSGATQSVDFSASNKIHVATIDEDATISFVNPASVAKVDLILDVGGAGFDIANAAYAGKSFTDVQGGNGVRCLDVSPDGSKFYTLSVADDVVYQYTMSVPGDLSTASYDGVSLSLVAQSPSNPSGIRFKPDGSKLYVSDFSLARVLQYSLSTPWDLSTATYETQGTSISAGSLAFKPDGLKMFALSFTTDTVTQYTLSTPWDVSTLASAGVSPDLSAQDGNFYSIALDTTTGSRAVLYGTSSDAVYQYTLTTPWDITTLSYDSVSFSTAGQNPLSYDVAFNGAGASMYAMISSSTGVPQIFQYTTGTAFSVTLPTNLERPAFTVGLGQKTALQIVTYDGGTNYQAINVQGGIV